MRLGISHNFCFHATANKLTCLKEMNFPHSIGLLYSAFTYFLGFKVNSGEYKLMGLAPYGESDAAETARFKKIIAEKLCTGYDDGSVFLNQQYFNYATGLTMVKEDQWKNLFGIAKRKETDKISSSHCNLAYAIQSFTEEIVIKLAYEAKKITGSENLCMAGGVALNCVANGRLLQTGIFKNIFIRPAAGDAGAAIGAALAAYHIFYENNKPANGADMQGNYLGPAFSNEAIEKVLKEYQATFNCYEENDLYDKVAAYIDEGSIAGWFNGRIEEWGQGHWETEVF